MRIIDIHTHILYGIDDGSASLDMSMQMMGMMAEQGVRGIFLTNHSYGMKDRYADYHRRFEALHRLTVEKYPQISLYKGCEILGERREMSAILRSIREDIYPSLNESKYILMEFDPYFTDGVDEMTYCLQYTLDHGYIPIIAHAERYQSLYDDPLEDISRLRESGCLIQINLYSVEQDQGHVGGGSRKRLANLFLQRHLVNFAGSDTHRLGYKPPNADIGAAAILERYGEDYARQVLYANAETLLGCRCAE